MSDVRRMNVALTRSKHFLFVIANTKSITVNPYWRDLVEHARVREAVIQVPFSVSQQSYSFPDLSTLKAVTPPLKHIVREPRWGHGSKKKQRVESANVEFNRGDKRGYRV